MKLTSAFVAAASGIMLAIAGCEEKKNQPAPANTGTKAADPHDHGHDHGHGGTVIDLGTATIGAYEVKATRDAGEIEAGKDAPIDVTVSPAAGAAAPAAVRFWIGTEDAKGSVKAKGEIEDPKEPNRWHSHAEIPNPLPDGSRLWVEIEVGAGDKVIGNFDLKR